MLINDEDRRALLAETEAHRRERPSLNAHPLPQPDVMDYAVAGALVQAAMHHLDESIPSGQKRRTELALQLLACGSKELIRWCRLKGYDTRVPSTWEQRYLAAERTLEGLHFTYEGGSLWKPPLGVTPEAEAVVVGARRKEAEAELLRRGFVFNPKSAVWVAPGAAAVTVNIAGAELRACNLEAAAKSAASRLRESIEHDVIQLSAPGAVEAELSAQEGSGLAQQDTVLALAGSLAKFREEVRRRFLDVEVAAKNVGRFVHVALNTADTAASEASAAYVDQDRRPVASVVRNTMNTDLLMGLADQYADARRRQMDDGDALACAAHARAQLLNELTRATASAGGLPSAERGQLYVLGFAFTPGEARAQRVVLIRKERGMPHLVGLWNGLGGRVREGETVHEAMSREFREECGLDVPPGSWRVVMPVQFARGRGGYILTATVGEDPGPLKSSDEGVADLHQLTTLVQAPSLYMSNILWMVGACLDPEQPVFHGADYSLTRTVAHG